ncbi:MAG: hypothetical protein ACI39N_00260 [Lachnospiraceae bacterium]
MEKLKTKVILWNIIIPIFLGATIYYLISPEVIFVRRMDFLIGKGIHISDITAVNLTIRIMRNYLPDMLWGYALIFTLYYFLNNNTAYLLKTFLIASLFSAVMEFLQITPVVKGTFDWYDIIVELLAEVIAVFIIKKLLLRRKMK